MIFIMILSVVLVTAASFTTKLLFNIKINEHRAIANFYVDDLKEWLNGERESNNWNTFHSRASTTPANNGTVPPTPAGQAYCINSPLSLSSTLAGLTSGLCPSYNGIQTQTAPIYKRELFLYKDSAVNPTQVIATIRMSWIEVGRPTPLVVTIQSIYIPEF